MALLTVEARKTYFKFLGLGEYNKTNIKKFQKKYLRAKDVDGVYGTDTDRALRHVYNVKKNTKNFEPEEFKCECGGRYCTGYPSWMKKVELQNLQSIRTHFNKPMTITCGLRCKTYNSKLSGSIPNSKHLSGYAADFYMAGVTDSLANRKSAIKWIKKLPNHNYTYGNGINSKGVKVAASYMGNALHTDTNKPITTVAKSTTTKTTTSTPKWVADANAWAKKIAADNSWHYVVWTSNAKTHECPICHKHPKGAYHGWNCIGFSFAYWHHGGGLKCKCNCGVIDNGFGTRLLTMNSSDALAQLRKKIGLKDIQLIRNGKKNIPRSKMKAGDLCLVYDKNNKYIHIYPYIGNGYMIDSGHWSDTSKQIAKRKASACKVIIRYTGK